MDGTKLTENLEMLNKLYEARQENLGKISNVLQSKLNDVSVEEVQKLIQENIENNKNRDKVLKELDLLIEDYEIKMSDFMEQSYKQGFKDAFNLFVECTKK